MSVKLRHAGVPEPKGPRKPKDRPGILLFEAVKCAAPTLKLTFRELAYLKFSIERCCDRDFEPGAICAHWVGKEVAADSLGCSPRHVTSIERSLEAKDLISRTFGGRGRRNGARSNGAIAFAAGINLEPLIRRFAEFQSLGEARAIQERAAHTARAEAQLLRRQISEKGSSAQIAKAEQILPRGRTSEIKNLDRLQAIVEALEAVLNCIDPEPGRVETSTRSDETSSRSEICDQPNIHKTNFKNNLRARERRGPRPITNQQVMLLASASFRSFVDDLGGPSADNFAVAARAACPGIGIKIEIWNFMCQKMGQDNAALAVLVLDRNWRLPEEHRYRRDNPAGSAIRIARKWESGGVNLRGLLLAGDAKADHEVGDTSIADEFADPPPMGAALGAVMSRLKLNFLDLGQ